MRFFSQLHVWKQLLVDVTFTCLSRVFVGHFVVFFLLPTRFNQTSLSPLPRVALRASGSYVLTPAGGRAPLPGQLEPDGPLASVILDLGDIPVAPLGSSTRGDDRHLIFKEGRQFKSMFFVQKNIKIQIVSEARIRIVVRLQLLVSVWKANRDTLSKVTSSASWSNKLLDRRGDGENNPRNKPRSSEFPQRQMKGQVFMWCV